MGAADGRAPNVCANCKARKKRCDKALPRCRYCADHDIACRYQYQTSSSSPRHASASPGWSGAIPLPTALPVAEPSPCAQAQRLLESTGLYLDEISVRYFRGIHTFVPVVSRRQFQASLLSFGANPQVDFALLLLCMALLTAADSPDSGGRRVGNHTLYLAIKSLMARAQALCAPTTRLVQAGVLLAVYEYASGHPETAFITIGSSARMAYAARLRSSPLPTGPVPRTDWIAEEESNVWWGIRICERTFLCELPVVEQPLGSVMPAADDRLPLESDILAYGNPAAALASSVAIHAVSAPQVGGFGRAAQAAWLLDGVLQGLAITDADRKRTHLADCDRTLQSFLAVVMQQMQQRGGNYGPFCVATALTIRALFLLHWHLLDQLPQNSPGSYEQINGSHSALDTVTQMVIDICTAHEPLSFGEIDHLPPSCLYIIRAAMKHIRSSQSTTPDPRLYTSLKQFEARWGASSTLP